jgi:hypothetical protein
MRPDVEALDPALHAGERFDYFSMAAFASGMPEVLSGAALGQHAQIVEASDVLLSRIVPHPRRAWVVGQGRGRRQVASAEWMVLRGSSYDPGYLRHLLVSNHFHVRFMRLTAGSNKAVLRARPAQIASIDVPLPALPVQRRIAMVLDAADTLRTKRRTVLAEIDSLAPAYFVELFGDPVAASRGWPQVALADCLTMPPVPGAQTVASGEEDDWIVLRLPFDPERAEPAFIRQLFRTRAGQALLDGVSRRFRTRIRLDTRVIATLRVPLPPIANQREFVRALAAIEKQKAVSHASAAELDALLVSLRDRAYRGDLLLA